MHSQDTGVRDHAGYVVQVVRGAGSDKLTILPPEHVGSDDLRDDVPFTELELISIDLELIKRVIEPDSITAPAFLRTAGSISTPRREKVNP
jgi:hypothetical protein